MGKKLLLCMVLVLAVMSSASAEPHLWSCYYSLSGLIEGHSDYSSARFGRMYMDIEDDEPENLLIGATKGIEGGYQELKEGVTGFFINRSISFLRLPTVCKFFLLAFFSASITLKKNGIAKAGKSF